MTDDEAKIAHGLIQGFIGPDHRVRGSARQLSKRKSDSRRRISMLNDLAVSLMAAVLALALGATVGFW
jgi:hypothetical protein